MPDVVRLGAVEYLNARPLVHGLERRRAFSLRFDVPSRCAALLHENSIDVGLIPSIEYLRAPRHDSASGTSQALDGYRIVPDVAIASRGAVASVVLFASKELRDVRSITLDTSSRTSVALARVLCARVFRIDPDLRMSAPDLPAMLAQSDAALIIGDKALFQPPNGSMEKIDLGLTWTEATGLPFVYAFWAGRAGALTDEHVCALQEAKADGVRHSADIARGYCPESAGQQQIAVQYLRDNIQYDFGPDERAGLELFYRYSAELGLVDSVQEVRFF